MVYYQRLGTVPPKRHTQFRKPDGEFYYEQMQGEEGFAWNQSFLYHQNPPTVITGAESVDQAGPPSVANEPLLPRHLRTHELAPATDAVLGRHRLMGNSDLTISYVHATESSGLYRNAVGDELVYVEAGGAVVESSFGELEVRAGDYVVIPTSTTHQWRLTSESLRLLIVESSGGGHIRPPKRFMSPLGQFLDGSPYNERDVRGPSRLIETRTGPADVLVRTRTGVTRYSYAFHPFDVVGWDGYNYPYALNIADYMPSTGALHLPPPTYITFEAPGFVICSFVPRMFDYHPEAVKVPYAHANVDSDEVLFYTGGDFMSRAGSGIDQGSISLHPAGYIHGPQAGSLEKSLSAERTEETAVMIDTFRPLFLGEAAAGIEDADYPWSWAHGWGQDVTGAR
ncbi:MULTISPECIES: homogentisate 1,2-dioxygenase [unclassified Streptomyces]|uniref:homogentisate 1,2-dioxygenase n=1 Tax=unclassified Streptomyces TaxID=2593676 RepID=UPI001370EC51|nr:MULTISPECIES: homogentisate 1,2-dioxygenase [unclassified Streptomyces]MCW5253510.1 homogentisate 1,2-dioxygenase [Streptomyces sp. SHP 1-2]MYU24086.1 homogentisate 1,2-dioxygenase [Streptomyces sp. SID8352]